MSLASSLLGSGGEPVGRPIQCGRHKCVAHHDSDPKVKSHNCNHITTRREGRWRDAGSAFIGGPLTYRRASVCHAQIDFFFSPLACALSSRCSSNPFPRVITQRRCRDAACIHQRRSGEMLFRKKESNMHLAVACAADKGANSSFSHTKPQRFSVISRIMFESKRSGFLLNNIRGSRSVSAQ